MSLSVLQLNALNALMAGPCLAPVALPAVTGFGREIIPNLDADISPANTARISQLVESAKPYLDTVESRSYKVSGFPVTFQPLPVYLSAYIPVWRSTVLFFNDNQNKFCSLLNVVRGYIDQSNEILGAAANSNTVAKKLSFRSPDFVATAGITALTSDLSAYRQDLINLGNALSFKYLESFGDPASFIQTVLEAASGLPAVLLDRLVASGLSRSTILTNSYSVADKGLIYRTLLAINGADLGLLLSILRVRTAGLETAADLLDPKKLFPLSFSSFAKAANFSVPKSAQYLFSILPESVVLRTVEFRTNALQTNNIISLTPEKLASVVANLALTGASIPTGNLATIPVVESALGTGTGRGNRYRLVDGLGSLVGHNLLVEIAQLNALVLDVPVALRANFDSLGLIMAAPDPEIPELSTDPLTPQVAAFEVVGSSIIASAVSTLGINQYATSFEARNAEVTRLLNDIEPEWNSYTITHGDKLSAAHEAYLTITSQLAREHALRYRAEEEGGYSIVESTRATNSNLVSFVKSLHEFGANPEYQEFVGKLTSNQYIIGCLREGKNIKALQAAGINNSILVSSTPSG